MLRGQNYENAFTFNILYLILLIHNTLSLGYNLIYVILSPEYRCRAFCGTSNANCLDDHMKLSRKLYDLGCPLRERNF